MITIDIKLIRLFGASAITFYPWIFIYPYLLPAQRVLILRHEQVHLAQQRRWTLYGLGIGLLMWHFLYLFCLPVGWNPWRRRWETEAYKKANGLKQEEIDAILCKAPYYLWR